MNDDHYLDPSQASERVKVAKSTLARWRVEGTGPRFMKAGRKVLYLASDLHEWVISTARQSTSQSA